MGYYFLVRLRAYYFANVNFTSALRPDVYLNRLMKLISSINTITHRDVNSGLLSSSC